MCCTSRRRRSKLNSCGELSLIESMDHTYIVFSPLDTYEDYNKRYELTKTYLYPLAEGCTQNFTSPEGSPIHCGGQDCAGF